jgi:hypothetical protein
MTRISRKIRIGILLSLILPCLSSQDCRAAEALGLTAPEGTMKVNLEIFLVTLAGDTSVRYAVNRHDITRKPLNPDSLVQNFTFDAKAGSVLVSRRNCYVHSTSWRYEQDGSIVLTYLVYSDRMEFMNGAGTVLKLEDVAVTVSEDPTRPRPAVLMEEQIVLHGIRHLSYLAKTANRSLLDVITPESLRRFGAMDSLLAGKFN